MIAFTVRSNFGAQENKIFHISPSICHKVVGLGAMILVFCLLSFKPAFSLSSLTFIKRLFSSSPISAIRAVSSAYLRLLIFLLAILTPACASSSPAFHMMYSVYKSNKQGNSMQPWRTPFPVWNQSIVLCLVLTLASWAAYRFLMGQVIGTYSFPNLEPVRWSISSSNYCFLSIYRLLRRQVRWFGIPISLRIFHSLLWSTQKL